MFLDLKARQKRSGLKHYWSQVKTPSAVVHFLNLSGSEEKGKLKNTYTLILSAFLPGNVTMLLKDRLVIYGNSFIVATVQVEVGSGGLF